MRGGFRYTASSTPAADGEVSAAPLAGCGRVLHLTKARTGIMLERQRVRRSDAYGGTECKWTVGLYALAESIVNLTGSGRRCQVADDYLAH